MPAGTVASAPALQRAPLLPMLLPRIVLPPALLSAIACVGAGALPAQCANQWLPGSGLPGPNGPVTALTRWDPDGPGPAPEQLVLGGSFLLAGTVAASHIAAWDPAADTWSALGSGLNGAVYAF